MSEDMLADVVAAIKESADEIKNKPNQDNQDYGQLLAYAETLSIIRDACDAKTLTKIRLDFDIDARYL